MSETIRAKKIEYQGALYDSQLEADWAATLESWGIRFQHHPGSLSIPDADGGGRYEPDFLLEAVEGHSPEILAEVKGPDGDRLWKAESVSQAYSLPVVVLRKGLVVPGSDNETAGAVWHGVKLWGLEWVIEFTSGGALFTQSPVGTQVRVSAERCLPRPEATGIGMRKALGREIRDHG